MSSAARVLLSPAKAPRKKNTSQKRKTGPTVSELILKAASASSERGGVSLATLKKALEAGGYDVVTNKARIITAIKRLVASRSLVQSKGTGATGSFRLNKKPPTPRETASKKKKKKKKKPKPRRVRRTSPSKAAGDDAARGAKKSPKKRRTSKSPAKSPKKAKRRTATSTRTRAAAARRGQLV
ncbi:histone H1.5 [Spinachia spinachia]